MSQRPEPGRIVLLNGVPRAGKSSIAAAIQERFDGPWMNLGVDAYIHAVTPPRYRPGLGLRPGGERPDLEPLVPVFYAALYESIAAHSRLGLNVVADVAHHDAYAMPRHILPACARRLAGLPVLFVGVRCPLDEVMRRRAVETPGRSYATGTAAEPVPAPVAAWQRAVHDPGVYDLEVDTAAMSPEACADAIAQRLAADLPSPSAFERLAAPG